MQGQFENCVAIVTGGASGIGRAVCEALGSRGARVTVADMNGDGAEAVAAGIRATGGRARAVPVDVTQADAVQQLVDGTVAEQGRLDYMFNNAGIAIFGDYQDLTPDHWRRIVDVNLWGVIYGTTAAYEVMLKQGSGHIVNTASVAGLIPTPTEISYGTTKFAVVGLSASLRSEAAPHGIKVSVVCPGIIRTPLMQTGEILHGDRDKILANLPPGVMEPARAAEHILRGVARNRAYIVFPLGYRVLWWAHRLWPPLLAPLSWWMIREMRRARLPE